MEKDEKPTETLFVAGFLVTKTTILLAIKKQKIGAGFYMPYGGKVEPGERARDAMMRELKEESGVSCAVEDLREVGVLFTCNRSGEQCLRGKVILYFVEHWTGTPIETDEMHVPRSFRRQKRALPLSQMLEGDQIWLPRVLAGKYILAYLCYDLSTMRLEKLPLELWEMNPHVQHN